MPTEYYIKQTGEDRWSLAKFCGRDLPEEVYTVQGHRCSCHAYRSGKTRPCKHFRMVSDFIASGAHTPYCRLESD